MAPPRETNVSIDINPSFFYFVHASGGWGFTWMGWTSSFVCFSKVWLAVKPTEIKAFFQGTSLPVQQDREPPAWQPKNPCFPDSVSPLCPVQSIPSGYSSLPWCHPTEHYYSSFNTQLWPCTSCHPVPRPSSGPECSQTWALSPLQHFH